MLLPMEAMAAGAPGNKYISIDGITYYFSFSVSGEETMTWEEVVGVITDDGSFTNVSITFSDDGHVVFQEKYLTMDGVKAIKKTDSIEYSNSAGSPVAYYTIAIPLDFTAPESLSMKVTQGHSDLAIAPCVITNTGAEDLKLSQVEINAASGWTVVNASTDFTTADSKNKIAFTAGSHDFADGAYTPKEKITAGSSTTLQLAGKISEKADLTNATQVASMVLTVEKVELIAFKIGTGSYQAEEGMTWGEWAVSIYNTDGYIASDEKVTTSNSKRVYYKENSVNVYVIGTDLINPNINYAYFNRQDVGN